MERDRAVLAAAAVVTAALAVVAPLFTVLHERYSAAHGAYFGSDVSGWGSIHQFSHGIALSSTGGVGHEIRFGVVLEIGAVVLLAGVALLLVQPRSAGGPLLVALAGALIAGAMIVALLDATSARSHNDPVSHTSLGVSFWLFMVEGVLALGAVALGSRELLRRAGLSATPSD